MRRMHVAGVVGRASSAGSHRLQLGLLLGAAALLCLFTLNIRLPRHTLLLEEELEELVESHLHRKKHPNAACGCGPAGVPLYCRLGLPLNSTASGAPGADAGAHIAAGVVDLHADAGVADGSGSSRGGTASANASASASGGGAAGQQEGAQQAQQAQQEHRLAVLIPYRDRQAHLSTLLATLRPFLDRQGRAHDVFVVEQADGYLFNRGALLNAAALLLQGSSYDYFCFQDVDTVPVLKGNVSYSFPKGDAPLHLTPNWIHPKSTFEDFFGGLLIVTAEQFRRLNGFGTQFWGWGREDDNLRERLVRAGMWPPEYPEGVPHKATHSSKRAYFTHQKHEQAAELRAAEGEEGEVRYFQENPNLPFRGAKIMSSQPQFLKDLATGLNTTMFQLLSMQPFSNATKISLQLHCNTTATPWCEPASLGSRQGAAVKHAAAVHAVVGS